ncbi:hypothetical protein J7T55_009749 [Diaporthe amygdali]|uniref:uncharacterized protein n=1 Tax=Phomopsis amygdali TaxID=1214568 RepID=UPI0022FE4ACA|nr:uncharacterized protein J7T55_009749 [Diaporthe amygdali]KAJ0116599.1 hypothetical protein J7T55_009749 [Diaporthe amygdali]
MPSLFTKSQDQNPDISVHLLEDTENGVGVTDKIYPDCIDDDLVQEFDRSGSRPDGTWPYFEAEYDDSTSHYSFIPLESSDIDMFAREGKEYFTTREWHVSHCLFTWKKQFRALSNGRSIEPWNNNEEHIKHCSDYILEAMRSGSRLDDVETLILGVDRHKHE